MNFVFSFPNSLAFVCGFVLVFFLRILNKTFCYARFFLFP